MMNPSCVLKEILNDFSYQKENQNDLHKRKLNINQKYKLPLRDLDVGGV
jgi:hypothetical protein